MKTYEDYCRNNDYWDWLTYHQWLPEIRNTRFSTDEKKSSYAWLLKPEYCTKNMMLDVLKYPHVFYHKGARDYLLHEYITHQSWQLSQLCFGDVKTGYADVWHIPFWEMLRIEYAIVLTEKQNGMLRTMISACDYIKRYYPYLLDEDVHHHFLSIYDKLTSLNQSNHAVLTSGDIHVMQ